MCKWLCNTGVQPNVRERVKVKLTIILECSDLFQTDGSERVKGFIIRRWQGKGDAFPKNQRPTMNYIRRCFQVRYTEYVHVMGLNKRVLMHRWHHLESGEQPAP